MKKYTPHTAWEFVDVKSVDECWPWTGTLTSTGYGYITIQQEKYVAHRVVYSLSHPNEIQLRAPKNKHLKQFVLHSCDNRICCNPNHLFIGSYDDNNKDAAKKGRTSRSHGVKGIRNYMAKLDSSQIAEIRWLASKFISNGEIQKRYPVSNEAIRRVVNLVSYVDS